MTDIFESPVKETKEKAPCIIDPFPQEHVEEEDHHLVEPPPHCFVR
jgi:hypothetical protein